MIIEPDNLSLPRSREIVDLIAELGFAPPPESIAPLSQYHLCLHAERRFVTAEGNYSPDFISGL